MFGTSQTIRVQGFGSSTGTEKGKRVMNISTKEAILHMQLNGFDCSDIEKDLKDAERYRFLRDSNNVKDECHACVCRLGLPRMRTSEERVRKSWRLSFAVV